MHSHSFFKWQALPDGVRKEYERKAKEIKARQKGSDGDMGRLDCVGNIIGVSNVFHHFLSRSYAQVHMHMSQPVRYI